MLYAINGRPKARLEAIAADRVTFSGAGSDVGGARRVERYFSLLRLLGAVVSVVFLRVFEAWPFVLSAAPAEGTMGTTALGDVRATLSRFEGCCGVSSLAVLTKRKINNASIAAPQPAAITMRRRNRRS